MKKKLMWLMILFTITISAQDLEVFFKNSDAFFKTHVKDGKVNYKTIKKNTAPLNNLLDLAEAIRVNTKDKLNYKAFWINTYNLLVIKGIVTHFPIKSPLDIDGFFDKIKYNVGGISTTLNTIENKQLRSKYNDARFHFVLVCAGLGCPPIIPEAYTPNKLEKQLTKQTKLAINNPNFTKVNLKKKQVVLSEIFKWYKEDFTKNGMSFIDFINQYINEKVPNSFKIKFYTYNWNLNKI